jgi:hypothetical protein
MPTIGLNPVASWGEDYKYANMLYGYVAGVYDTWLGAHVICASEGITAGQAVGILKNYLKDNPAK